MKNGDYCRRGLHLWITKNIRRGRCYLCTLEKDRLFKRRHQGRYALANKRYRETHKAERIMYHRKLMYGLSNEAYMQLVDKQQGKCAVCQQEKKLVIDHNHQTKEVRGLLCHYCNTRLIPVIEHSNHLIEKARTYLLQRPQLHFGSTSLSITTHGLANPGLK